MVKKQQIVGYLSKTSLSQRKTRHALACIIYESEKKSGYIATFFDFSQFS